MKEVTRLSDLDLSLTYSYADYISWKFEEAIELIKGKVMPMAGPSRLHQQISWQLTLVLGAYLKESECHAYAAPFDVRLFDRSKSAINHTDVFTVVQPDLCIICDEAKLDDQGCFGAPDLVIEILSPGNSAKEMRVKKKLYEENKIREYWIFDPEHETVFQFYLLDSGAYSHAHIYINEDSISSAIFPNFKIDLKEIFIKK